MNSGSSSQFPPYVKELKGDVEENYWQPQSLLEWTEIQKTLAFLDAWTKQQEQERGLRKMIGIWVFILISVQVLGVFTLVVLTTITHIRLNFDIIKILIPSVLTEIFGMGFLVVKYLFPLTSKEIFNLDKH